MSLISEAMTECIRLNPKREPDKSGGNKTTWEEGERFRAAIVFDGSSEQEKAEKAGTSERYTITVPKNVVFGFHEVFRRISDGKVFRATSDTIKTTPERAMFRFSQFTAEEWRLPK